MTTDDIRIYGDDSLRKIAEPIVVFDDRLKETVEEMFEVMLEAEGIGLAAPQVGISKAYLIIDMPRENEEPERLFFANPKLLETRDESPFNEGCLSVPDISEEVIRPEWIRLNYQDINGTEQALETGGLLARVLQHEIDHLNGILFVDRLSPARKALLKNELKKLAEEGPSGTHVSSEDGSKM